MLCAMLLQVLFKFCGCEFPTIVGSVIFDFSAGFGLYFRFPFFESYFCLTFFLQEISPGHWHTVIYKIQDSSHSSSYSNILRTSKVCINHVQWAYCPHTLPYFGTDAFVCFPRMQCWQMAGRVDKSVGIPNASPCLAILMTVAWLMWPRQWCHVSRVGVACVIFACSMVFNGPVSVYSPFCLHVPCAIVFPLAFVTVQPVAMNIMVLSSSTSLPNDMRHNVACGANRTSFRTMHLPFPQCSLIVLQPIAGMQSPFTPQIFLGSMLHRLMKSDWCSKMWALAPVSKWKGELLLPCVELCSSFVSGAAMLSLLLGMTTVFLFQDIKTLSSDTTHDM